MFYVVENWRGQRAWAECKRELAARGARLDWDYYIPPPVPAEQNVFGVPEMSQWFVKKRLMDSGSRSSLPGGTDLAMRLSYAGLTNATRLVVAHIVFGQANANPPADCTVLPWLGEKSAQTDAARLMMATLGPIGDDAASQFHFMLKSPGEVQPVQLFFRCEKLPTDAERAAWIKTLRGQLGVEDPQLQRSGENAYRVSVVAPIKAADYAAWGETIQPELAIMREAVKRPYARMPGNYWMPYESPVPNFVNMRITAQRLSTLARCHLLLHQPEKALEDLALLHELSRLLEARPTGRPITLVAAMMHVALKGLYVETIRVGMQLQSWKEPQLAVLQKQLEETNLRASVAEAFSTEQAGIIGAVERTPKAELVKFFRLSEVVNEGKNQGSRGGSGSLLFTLIPQGWVDKNLAVFASMEQIIKDGLDPRREDIEPRKLDAIAPTIEVAVAKPTPYKLLAAIAVPNFTKACHAMAYRHVQVVEGRIACALERYRLAHGEYPLTLEALSGQFLARIPQDPIGSQPFHYRRTDPGNFVLYSVGWNEKDDGGLLSPTPSDSDERDRPDWVWRYPDVARP